MADTKSNKNKPTFTKKEVQDGKIMAILSYIGILALIPYFAEKNNKYVIEHAKRGMNLFLLEVIIGVGLTCLAGFFAITIIFIGVTILIGLVEWVAGILALIISIIGIVNACNGEVKDLPIIGKIRIIK